MSHQNTQSPDREGAGNLLAMLNQPASRPETDQSKKPEQALNRACEACRTSKVRCLANPDPTSSVCQRCAKAGRTCIFAPPVKRRQRKRTDVRVAELEKEIKKMQSALMKGQQRSPSAASDHESADEGSERDNGAEELSPLESQRQGSTTTTASTLTHSWPNIIGPKSPRDPPLSNPAPKDLLGPVDDIIDRGVITREFSEEMLNLWRNELVAACPGIYVPKDWSAAQLREKKPSLFHAIMAAAAHAKGSELSDKLHEEAVFYYARTAFINGEKSVQTIQALLVTVAFCSPPKTPGQLQIYQWVNMAASMALELGLASKPRTHEQLPKRAIRSLQKISSPEELLEHCRTVLYLYVVCAGFSMRLKRPNILLFNSWMEECLNMLEKSPLQTDQRTLAWLKLQRIADEANTAFGFDDASTSFSLSELRMQMILRIFERRMLDWKKSVPKDVLTLTLTVEYHQNMLSMWEFGMDGGRYDVTEFRNRHLTLPALDDDSVQPESLLSRSALQINATTKCIIEAHAILECFVGVPKDTLQKAPNLIFVRAIYALVVLMKADYAVGTDPEMGEILDSQSLKVDHYLQTVHKKSAEAIGPQKCRPPTHWTFVLEQKLMTWRQEYLDWRKEGRHLKRRKVHDDSTANTSRARSPATGAGETNNAKSQPDMPPPPQAHDADLAPHMAHAPQPTPLHNTFNMANPYAWSPSSLPPGSGSGSGTSFTPTPDMGDFSAAFQNGDLYLWNDINDNFGGWIPQGGSLYSDMGFGSLNGQGY
ncbi:fungal specific transcription factor [Stagonosporopsis vannaccii]|nr:fungal specific transcription factor [Stagonosporopsis vannaccii]